MSEASQPPEEPDETTDLEAIELMRAIDPEIAEEVLREVREDTGLDPEDEDLD